MDYLLSAISNLLPREKSLLQKKIKTQKLKLRLFELIESDPLIENERMSSYLFGKKALNKLYTLKNRLLDDIIQTKIELHKSPLITTKEAVQNLRNMVYSHDRISLLRELKKCEKSAKPLELYSELREIYFCYFLIYRHEVEKLNKYKNLVSVYGDWQSLIFEMEQIFYSSILDKQDLFYYFNEKELQYSIILLNRLKEIHDLLNSKTSLFLLLSAELILILNSKSTINNSKEVFIKLKKLDTLYRNSFLENKYPNCHVAIECLFSKFYFLVQDHSRFRSIQDRILLGIRKTQGYLMFDCTFFYFIYVSIISLKSKHRFEKIVRFIDDMIFDNKMEVRSNKMKGYFFYLFALKEYYNENYSKSSSLLLRSREFFKNLDNTSSWVVIENILLNIINYEYSNESYLIESEINLLRRSFKRYSFSSLYSKHFKEALKSLRKYENGTDKNGLTNFVQTLNRELKLFNLVQIK